MKRYYILLLSLFISACTTTNDNKPPFTPQLVPQGKAIIYIYRPNEFVNGGAYPYAYINGIEKSPVYTGSYKPYIVKPGKHEITLKGSAFTWGSIPDKTVNIETKEGNIYYYRLSSQATDVTIIGSFTYIGRNIYFIPVPESVALSQLNRLELPERLEKQWEEEQKEIN